MKRRRINTVNNVFSGSEFKQNWFCFESIEKSNVPHVNFFNLTKAKRRVYASINYSIMFQFDTKTVSESMLVYC